MGATQAREPQTGVLQLWREDRRKCRVYDREVQDLPWSAYRTTVMIELYRVRCPECRIKVEKVPLLPTKASFSQRFEEAVGQAYESASVGRVAGQFGLASVHTSGSREVLDETQHCKLSQKYVRELLK